MCKQAKIEEYDEHTTRIYYEDIEQLQRYHKTAEVQVFRHNKKVREIWHIIKKEREE